MSLHPSDGPTFLLAALHTLPKRLNKNKKRSLSEKRREGRKSAKHVRYFLLTKHTAIRYSFLSPRRSEYLCEVQITAPLCSWHIFSSSFRLSLIFSITFFLCCCFLHLNLWFLFLTPPLSLSLSPSLSLLCFCCLFLSFIGKALSFFLFVAS